MSKTVMDKYIGGEWLPAASGKSRGLINPFNGSVIAEVTEGDREDAQRAIRAARQAFDSNVWSDRRAAERGSFLSKLADRIHRVAKQLRFGTVWINDFNVYFTQAPPGAVTSSQALGVNRGARVLKSIPKSNIFSKTISPNHQDGLACDLFEIILLKQADMSFCMAFWRAKKDPTGL